MWGARWCECPLTATAHPPAPCADVEERIARWSLLPVGNGEGLQVLRYGLGQKYDAHWGERSAGRGGAGAAGVHVVGASSSGSP